MVLKEIKKGETGTGYLLERDAGFIDLSLKGNEKLNEDIESFNAGGEWHIPYPLIVHAVFQKADTPNANHRRYPMDILAREITKYNKKCEDRRGYSELDHPENTVISTKGLALNVLKLWFEGKTVVGDAEILISPGYVKYGIISCDGDKLANYLFFNKVKLGVSSRAVGSVHNVNGEDIVDQDLELLCFDCVSDPSTPNAWIGNSVEELQPYMENKEPDPNKIKLIENLDRVLKLI